MKISEFTKDRFRNYLYRNSKIKYEITVIGFCLCVMTLPIEVLPILICCAAVVWLSYVFKTTIKQTASVLFAIILSFVIIKLLFEFNYSKLFVDLEKISFTENIKIKAKITKIVTPRFGAQQFYVQLSCDQANCPIEKFNIPANREDDVLMYFLQNTSLYINYNDSIFGKKIISFESISRK